VICFSNNKEFRGSFRHYLSNSNAHVDYGIIFPLGMREPHSLKTLGIWEYWQTGQKEMNELFSSVKTWTFRWKKYISVQEVYLDWFKEEGTSSLSGQFLSLTLDLDCCSFCISQVCLTGNLSYLFVIPASDTLPHKLPSTPIPTRFP